MRRYLPVLLLLFIAVAVAGYALIRFTGTGVSPEKPVQPVTETPEISADVAAAPAPPVMLDAKIQALGTSFDGDVGIAVKSVEDDWVVSHQGTRKFSQQSVSKLWVAATVMQRVDDGELSLDETVLLTAKNLTIFHQPIRNKILAGGYQPSIRELLRFAMMQSDNAANDALFRRVGGQAGVTRFLAQNDLNDISMSAGEKELQMGIAGMVWENRFSYGKNFWIAREKVPFDNRVQAMGNYLENPPDGATPIAIADGLSKLVDGELLSPRSSAYLIDLMAQSKTGPKRLRGGLEEGWQLPHKTGTGQVLKLLATAYNDVGILISPSGQRYAVAVMIGSTNRPVPERQALMQDVVRAVIACESSGADGC